MCMMCEEEAMYQAYLEYLARKGIVPTDAEHAGGIAAPQANPFTCDPASADGAGAAAPDADQTKPKVA